MRGCCSALPRSARSARSSFLLTFKMPSRIRSRQRIAAVAPFKWQRQGGEFALPHPARPPLPPPSLLLGCKHHWIAKELRRAAGDASPATIKSEAKEEGEKASAPSLSSSLPLQLPRRKQYLQRFPLARTHGLPRRCKEAIAKCNSGLTTSHPSPTAKRKDTWLLQTAGRGWGGGHACKHTQPPEGLGSAEDLLRGEH